MRGIELLIATARDLVPIMVLLFGAQYFVIRKRVPRLPRVLVGFLFVGLGLALFLFGLEKALFPLGTLMAEQLTSAEFLPPSEGGVRPFTDYAWVYLFAFAVGGATTIAEPSLIAVAMKAGEMSGGAIQPYALRVAVAFGVAIGITLGTLRIVLGFPLEWIIFSGYSVVLLQTLTSPKFIIPLAYDSGGVTTSTITVPIVTALGLGLATAIPGRSPLLDGFGMIALASVFPIISVMGFAQIAAWRNRKKSPPEES